MRKNKLSKISLKIKPQPMFGIMNEALELEKKGNKVIHLEVGGTSGFKNEKLLKIFKDLSNNPDMNYCNSAGLFELRELISEIYSKEKSYPFNYDNVAISCANMLISQILTVICDKNDGVLIPNPGFPTYTLAAQISELDISYYNLDSNNDWKPDLNFIKESILNNDKIKVIFVNTPSNPTGSVMKIEDLNSIIDIATSNGVYVVLDETYKNLIYSYDYQIKDIVTNEFVIFLYSFSKDLAIPGMRLGCLVGNKKLINVINNYSSLLMSSISPFFQKVLFEYLKLNQPFYKELKIEMIDRIDEANRIFSGIEKIQYIKPSSAFFYFIDISNYCNDSEKFALDLLNKENICVCPGSGFGPNCNKYIRISLSGNRDDLFKSLIKIANFLKQ